MIFLVENTVITKKYKIENNKSRKYAHTFPRPWTGNQCPLAIMYPCLQIWLVYTQHLSSTRATYFCLLKFMVKNLFKFNRATVKQSSFISSNLISDF